MIVWKIYINGTEVEQPKGLAEIILNVTRDDQWHGVFFEASSSVLTFYNDGAELLRAEKRSNGLAASATFRAEAECGETIDILEGNFDFGTYREKCGTICGIEISVEKSGCTMTLKNRYDQKVDLSKATAFDNTTLLPNYAGLTFEAQLLPQNLLIGNEAFAADTPVTEIITGNPNWVATDGFDNCNAYTTPPLPDVRNESLGTFLTSPIIDITDPAEPSANNHPPYPDFPFATGTATLLGDIACDLQNVTARFRVKGSAETVISGVSAVFIRVKVFRLPAGADPLVFANFVEEYSSLLFSNTTTTTTLFDTGDIVVPLANVVQGDWIYYGFYTRGSNLSDIDHFALTMDPECYYRLIAEAQCESSNAEVGLVNEIGARITESITDACLTMKSDYYGRIDSEPYVSTSDGCGGLRVLSNGLKIRRADNSNHFISLQEFYTGLRGIDNIGMGIEPNTVTGSGEWLRIEPVEYFYQNIKLLTLPLIPEAAASLEPTMGYSKILIGYPNWQSERVNGLGEFNSTKEFRTSLKTIDSTLDAQSNFVAGGIPIEVTRQQSFAETGAADTKFDNDTFIICVERDITPQVRESFFNTGAGPGVFYFPMAGGNFLRVGSVVAISGTASNNGNFTITGISDDGYYYYFTTAEATVLENFATATYTAVSGFFGVIVVEQGNIDNSANILSPATAYNWRIRPIYNLMRWFKSIAQSYVNLSNTTSKIFFSSGTGNYIAEGELPAGDPCKLERGVIAENDDLSKNEFAGNDYIPIYKPETITFDYPLSIAGYVKIKANPYGYIEYQCGNGNMEKGFIKSIAYKPVEGEATFTLIKKWQ